MVWRRKDPGSTPVGGDPASNINTRRGAGLSAVADLILGRHHLPYGVGCWSPSSRVCTLLQHLPQQPADRLGMGDVLDGWERHNQSILDSLHPGKDDEFLLSQSVCDAEQGFCSFPLSRKDFLQTIRNQPHRLIPRSSDANKLVLCNPWRVAQHISATHSWMATEDIQAAQSTDKWETGGEDWPNAYRHSPMSRSESMGCVVVFWHHEWGCPAYQLYTGLLFGLPLAVTSFNRYSRLVETLGRRYCYVLTSLYFDDACFTDWQVAVVPANLPSNN